jgi:chaperonin GroES
MNEQQQVVTHFRANGQLTPGEDIANLSDDFPVEVFSDICVCRQVIEVQSKGGLILPGEEKKARCARVVACGPGRIYENGVFVPNPVRVGDYVVFGKYASGGEALWFRQQEWVLFRAGDIVGKLKPGLTDLE